MNSLYSKVAKVLQTILNDKAEALAKSSGFIVRKRKLTGSGFIKTLVFGWLQNPELSLDGLVRSGFSHDVILSAQGLDKRFTRTAAAFVKGVLEEALGQVIQASTAVDVEILQRFSHVYVADGSVIRLPDELHELWQGSHRSAVKLDTCIELKTGQLQCETVKVFSVSRLYNTAISRQ
jgi:hypothetical protein